MLQSKVPQIFQALKRHFADVVFSLMFGSKTLRTSQLLANFADLMLKNASFSAAEQFSVNSIQDFTSDKKKKKKAIPIDY